jgi:hypothetical protein
VLNTKVSPAKLAIKFPLDLSTQGLFLPLVSCVTYSTFVEIEAIMEGKEMKKSSI